MIAIKGYYSTNYGELWNKTLTDIITEAIDGALSSSELKVKDLDVIFFSNMLSGILDNNLHIASRIAQILGVNIPVYRVESACASGGVAINQAVTYLQANKDKNVLVVGAEKMTDNTTQEVAYALMAAASGEEQIAGLTFPGVYAMMANRYMHEHGAKISDLSKLSIIGHHNGATNPKAQFKFKITQDDVESSSMIATPLRLLDCSPITDGASAVVISNTGTGGVTIEASEVAMDTVSLKHRDSYCSLKSTQIAAQKAYSSANIGSNKISMCEVHDCFSIAGMMALEDLGFYNHGEAYELEVNDHLVGGAGVTINPSGGLKACGHPVGATGIKQVGELFEVLKSSESQEYALAHNVGGSGGTAVVTILKKNI